MRFTNVFAAILLAGACLSPALADTTVQPPGVNPGWPQAHSDVPADPSVLFGVLPNGMRYAIRHNDTPSGQVSIRLRIAAGSLYESPKEAGIAHFLEHMAFRGSKNLPDGEAIKTMQSLGLSMGADLNAQTGAGETVFLFDLPSGQAQSLSKGLMLTREIAGNLSISPEAITSERQVVLGEMRQRDTPAEHMVRAELTDLFGSQLGSAMMPIGTKPALDAVTSDEMRSFYQAWYRPDRATLIVVGDVNPKATAEMIQQQFSDWKPASPAQAAPSYTLPQAKSAEVATFSQPGSPPVVSLNFIHPYDASLDNTVKERREVLRLLALEVLNQRFQTLAHGDHPPFISAAARYSPVDGIADLAETDASYAPGHAAEAVKAVDDTLASILAEGVNAAELDRAVKNFSTYLQSQVAAANSTPSPQLANSYVETLSQNDIITSPQEDLKAFDAYTAGLKPADIDAVLKSMFTGVPPQLFVAGPGQLPSAADLKGILDTRPAVSAAATSAPQAAKSWPYTNFGTPGTVVSRHTDAALGTTFVTFANGVRAIIKPTQFEKGQILVQARFGEGRLGTAAAQGPELWALNPALMLGGLGKLTVDDMDQVFAGQKVGATLQAADSAFSFVGETRPEDFDTELQLITAYMTDPAWRPNGIERGRAAFLNQLAQMQSSPDGVLQMALSGYLHHDDPRFALPTATQVQDTKLSDVRALLSQPMASSPLEIDIAGDISVDRAIDGIARTFAALPQRAAPQPVNGNERLPAPSGAPLVLHYSGNPGQAAAFIAWPGAGMFPDPQTARALRVLMAVVQTRLFDEVRTAQGLTYTPEAGSESSLATPGFGYLLALADVPPTKIDAFYTAVEKTVADLKARPISADELKRARDPLVHDLEHTRQSNQYWLSLLGGSSADPRKLALIQSVIPDTERVTPADIQALAQKYFSPGAWRVVVIPAGSSLKP